MTKKAIVWIREDFRIEDNEALAYASQNHEFVSALYIYNSKNFDKKREAQKWWLSKSLEAFNLDLKKFNISLEIQSGDDTAKYFQILKKKMILLFIGVKFMNLMLLIKEKKYVIYLLKMKLNINILKEIF